VVTVQTEPFHAPLVAFGMWPAEVWLIKAAPDGKAIWAVTGSQGRFVLKRVTSHRRAKKIAAVSHYLYRAGLPTTPALVSVEGKTSVDSGGGYYVLYPWVEGDHPAYASPGMIARLTELLARFHEGSRGYVPCGGSITDWRLDWDQVYRRLAAQLDRSAREAAAVGDPFGSLLLAQLPWLRERTAWVLDRLPDSPVGRLAEEARQDPLLCHGDYSRDNVLVSPGGALTIIDLDTVCVSMPAWDISRLITWANHDQQAWSTARMEAILQAYASVRPFSAAERDLLLLDQVFPHQAIAIARGYYDSPGRTTLLAELERCLQTDRAKLGELGIGPR
jgi:CotS family spore coat protein